MRNDIGILAKGSRNDGLTRLGGAMRRSGSSLAEIEAALFEHNSRRCQPPLPGAEVSRIARRVASYPVGGPDPLDAALQAVSAQPYGSNFDRFVALAPAELPRLLCDLREVEAVVLSRLTAPTPPTVDDTLLGVTEAARKDSHGFGALALLEKRKTLPRAGRSCGESQTEAVKAHGIPNQMRQSKAARDKGFEVTVPKQLPNDKQEQSEQAGFYRPDEGDRAELAKRWLEQARGKVQEPKD